MRYRCTLNGWSTFGEPAARVEHTPEGSRVVFEVQLLPSQAGQIEGVFHLIGERDLWIRDGFSNFTGYVFASPDNRELQQLLSELT